MGGLVLSYIRIWSSYLVKLKLIWLNYYAEEWEEQESEGNCFWDSNNHEHKNLTSCQYHMTMNECTKEKDHEEQTLPISAIPVCGWATQTAVGTGPWLSPPGSPRFEGKEEYCLVTRLQIGTENLSTPGQFIFLSGDWKSLPGSPMNKWLTTRANRSELTFSLEWAQKATSGLQLHSVSSSKYDGWSP